MNDDRKGIELLRATLERVAATVPPPSARARRARAAFRGGALVAAALLLVALGAWTLVDRGGGSPSGPAPGRPAGAVTESLPVEVKWLRLRGQDVDARIFEAAKANTIVVAPGVDSAKGARL